MWGCIVLLRLTFSFVEHVHCIMSVLCPYEHIMSIKGHEVPKQATVGNIVTEYVPVCMCNPGFRFLPYVFWPRNRHCTAIFETHLVFSTTVTG